MKQIAEHSTPPETPQIHESEITVRFALQEHGQMEVSNRCDLSLSELDQAIEKSLTSFWQALSGFGWPTSEDEFAYIDFKISCWILDDDLSMEQVEISHGDNFDAKDATGRGGMKAALELLRDKVRPHFLEALQKLEIDICD